MKSSWNVFVRDWYESILCYLIFFLVFSSSKPNTTVCVFFLFHAFSAVTSVNEMYLFAISYLFVWRYFFNTKISDCLLNSHAVYLRVVSKLSLFIHIYRIIS